MKTPSLKDLAIDHDYYCNENNYFNNKASIDYATFTDFYEVFHNADVDMNLVFRWDLHKEEESGTYYMDIFQIRQRKGYFSPIRINHFDEKDIPLFLEYIKPHMEKLKSIWKPLEF